MLGVRLCVRRDTRRLRVRGIARLGGCGDSGAGTLGRRVGSVLAVSLLGGVFPLFPRWVIFSERAICAFFGAGYSRRVLVNCRWVTLGCRLCGGTLGGFR